MKKRSFRLVIQPSDLTRYVVMPASRRRSRHSCQVLRFTRVHTLDPWRGDSRSWLYPSWDAVYSAITSTGHAEELTIESDATNEHFVISRKARDSKSGYSVQRYIRRNQGSNTWDWDEEHRFCTALDHLCAAIESGDYSKLSHF